MGNWIISPDEGVQNFGNGKFILPCETSDVTYTIQYIDGTCSSNTLTYVYATSGSCTPTPPPGECPTSPAGIIQVGDYLTATGGNNIRISVWVKENEVYTSHTVTSTDESIISNFTDGSLYPGSGRQIKANVASNESSDFRRYIDIIVTLYGPDLPSSGCPFTITLTQEGSCATINDTRYVGPMRPNYEIDSTAQTGAAIIYVPHIPPYSTTAWTTSYFIGTYSFVRNLTVIEGGGGPAGTRSMTVDIDENDTGADRTFKVKLVGKKTDGGQCTRTVEITQKKKDTPPPACDCLVVSDVRLAPMIMPNMKYVIGTYSDGCLDSVDSIICTDLTDEGIISETGTTASGDTNVIYFKANSNMGDERSNNFQINTTPTGCVKTFKVTQSGATPPPPSTGVTVVIHNDSYSSVELVEGYIESTAGYRLLLDWTGSIARGAEQTWLNSLDESIEINDVLLSIQTESGAQDFHIPKSCTPTFNRSRYCSSGEDDLITGGRIDIYLDIDTPR